MEQDAVLALKDILAVIVVAAAPIAELRGAIPLAIGVYDWPWYYALVFGIIGNLLPIPFILLFLDTITKLLDRIPLLNRAFAWFLEYTRRRSKIIKRYEQAGLVILVAIPLPFTGAWTGAVAASLIRVKFRYAFISIVIGVMIAGIVVTGATLLGWSIAGFIENQGS
jgi:uncharacterized membrane protein